MIKKIIAAILLTVCSTAFAEGKPNFLIVIADDLGWSDLGATGGEIQTPTLDSIADQGVLMTDFYVAPTCSPTRAMLMTGIDNHQAGVGTMSGIRAPNQVGRNYDAQLHDGVVTFPEILDEHGYQTFLAGKWHLYTEDEKALPQNRGFDRSYTLLQGGASHFGDKRPLNDVERPEYMEDGQHIDIPADFYSSINYTEKMLEYLESRNPDEPFLAYLAYTAPHDPLQVPDNWIDRYEGTYSMGPEALRQQRVARIKEMGLIPETADTWWHRQPPAWIPLHDMPWDERTGEQRVMDAKPMEIYAAMVELMDQQLGRIIEHLRSTGELNNTYIIFFSDNGASSAGPLLYPGNTVDWMAEHWPHGPEMAGKPGNFTIQTREWASASNSPFRAYKGWVGEGGIRSPLIVSGPGIEAGTRSQALTHVTDLAPTILELAGVDIEQESLYEGKLKPRGHSVITSLNGQSSPRTQFELEHFGNKAVRRGNWKATRINRPMGNGNWELFDLNADPGEAKNVAEQNPELLQELIAEWESFAQKNEVIVPNPPPAPRPRQLYWKECDWWCELKFQAMELLPAPG